MVTLRPASIDDLFSMQYCNVMNLPENYRMNYYFYHLLTWPQLTQVAEDTSGKVAAILFFKFECISDPDFLYILQSSIFCVKVYFLHYHTFRDEDEAVSHGHITSVAIMRSYRMLGLASKLMKLTHTAMEEAHKSPFVSLHVRVTNKAAYNLYSKVLGYTIKDVEHHYYADNEDAFNMVHPLNSCTLLQLISKLTKLASSGLNEWSGISHPARNSPSLRAASNGLSALNEKMIEESSQQAGEGVNASKDQEVNLNDNLALSPSLAAVKAGKKLKKKKKK
ncbi:N-acetyltransferase family protein [Cardiosporidium cionae]|uniref:N-acetyltransferase family protein n=1 Tax=Cardiosporidium cionae TaxID=476202 RepID=A0ABQ7JGH9_9APIC|nr:N-acetyltransferase family protein [Cardiosporidium cionae]|eukprot:KAF8823126.1 N-acetyltransferase family protein [Cardiosporidium cionae]